jgi:hypothetical protein
MSDTDPSDEFLEAFRECCTTGTCHVMCQLCGRTHFSSMGGYDWEEGELERLLEGEKKEPDKYVDHGSDTVWFDYIEGKQAVLYCPCAGLKRAEHFIVSNRELITTFLQLRHERLKDKMAREEEIVAKLPDRSRPRRRVRPVKNGSD